MFHCLAQINAWILLVKCANQEALLGVDKALLWLNLKSERISDERGRVKDKEKKDRKNAFRIWNLLSYYTVQKINYSIWLKKKKKKVGDRYVIQGQPEIIRNITDTGTSTPVHCMIAIMQLTFNNGLVWQYVLKCWAGPVDSEFVSRYQIDVDTM